MPGNSWSRWFEMRSSRVRNRTRPEPSSGSCTNRGSTWGTLRRANSTFSVFGLRTRTERLSERPEM